MPTRKPSCPSPLVRCSCNHPRRHAGATNGFLAHPRLCFYVTLSWDLDGQIARQSGLTWTRLRTEGESRLFGGEEAKMPGLSEIDDEIFAREATDEELEAADGTQSVTPTFWNITYCFGCPPTATGN